MYNACAYLDVHIILNIYICSVQSANLANLQIGWPICQSQIAQPICKWDDQSENLFEVLFSKYQTHTVLSHTLLLLEFIVSTTVLNDDIRHKL